MEWQTKDIPCAIVTIIASQGFTPRKIGAKMLVNKDGQSEGSVGGGAGLSMSGFTALWGCQSAGTSPRR
jgi:xanthine/CO dehydrogenase XdhC/CoxF family maturation factor